MRQERAVNLFNKVAAGSQVLSSPRTPRQCWAAGRPQELLLPSLLLPQWVMGRGPPQESIPGSLTMDGIGCMVYIFVSKSSSEPLGTLATKV